MKIHDVFDAAFHQYGTVLVGYSFNELIAETEKISEKPENGTIYVASEPRLETLDAAKELCLRGFGSLPIQIGYCNGSNTMLDCLEYHRSSELDIACDDLILLLAKQEKIKDGYIDSSEVEAFVLPKGQGVELYATTLHYAPCCAHKGEGFRMICVLPRGTNGAKPISKDMGGDDALCFGSNKWLLAHPQASEAAQGAFVGIKGENIDISGMI